MSLHVERSSKKKESEKLQGLFKAIIIIFLICVAVCVAPFIGLVLLCVGFFAIFFLFGTPIGWVAIVVGIILITTLKKKGKKK